MKVESRHCDGCGVRAPDRAALGWVYGATFLCCPDCRPAMIIAKIPAPEDWRRARLSNYGTVEQRFAASLPYTRVDQVECRPVPIPELEDVALAALALRSTLLHMRCGDPDVTSDEAEAAVVWAEGVLGA